MIGRTIVEFEGEKRRVDKIWVVPYFDFQLYFDAHNTWVDLTQVMAAAEGLATYKIKFNFATTAASGDVLSITGAGGELIVIGMQGGMFKVSNELGDNTLIMDATVAANDGQKNSFELNVTATGHELYVNGQYLNHAYALGSSGVSLPLPASITEFALGKGVLTGFFSGVIEDLVIETGGEVVVQLRLNDNADYVQELISGSFGSVYAGFWENGFNEDPQFREVLNAYICEDAGQFENTHRG